ncbi:MAG TPA: 30S ribosomal protein S18 [Chloroflexota bacterium]|jgi:small subunit ribosomal protein S18
MPPRSRPTSGPSNSSSNSSSSASEREYRKERYGRRKVCIFCVDKIKYVDYKDVNRLRRYLSDRAKIEPRRKSGVCAKHQRKLTTALKRARHMALLPFAPQHMRG